MNTLETVGRIPSFLKFDLRKLIFYLVSLVFLTLIYLKWGEVHDLREIFLKSNISWLLVAIFLQTLTYYFIALNYHYVFRIKGHELPVSSLAPLAFITQFINQTFPSSGISGQIFLIHYLHRRGATTAEGISRSILEIISMFCGFGLLFIIASVLFFTSTAFRQHPNLIYFIYIFWAFSAIAFLIFFAIQRNKNNGYKNGYLKRIINYFRNLSGKSVADKRNGNMSKVWSYWSVFTDQLKDSMSMGSLKESKTLFPSAVYCQFVVLILDVLTLWALTFALNIQLSFALVFIIFTFTQFISMFSFVPGSLLVYEGSMSIMLIAFGVDRGSALTLALLFRALLFWFPMPIGWLLYRQHERSHQRQVLENQ